MTEGRDTPEADKLRAAERAFEAGDYRRVRQLCDELRGASAETAQAARELRKRTEVDPVQIAVLLGCVAVFAWIVYTYVL